MRKYTAIVDRAPGAYGVSFPDLPGCVAMGATLAEAASNAAEALRAWILDAEGAGRAIPEPSTSKKIMRSDTAEELRAAGKILVLVTLPGPEAAASSAQHH